eukprot:scaffold33663_cov20-Prasinocladus_malaysianus.AAC.1
MYEELTSNRQNAPTNKQKHGFNIGKHSTKKFAKYIVDKPQSQHRRTVNKLGFQRFFHEQRGQNRNLANKLRHSQHGPTDAKGLPPLYLRWLHGCHISLYAGNVQWFRRSILHFDRFSGRVFRRVD